MYEKLRVMLVAGYTLKECAEEYGVTRQRISQIRKKLFPNLSRKDWGASKRALDSKKDQIASRVEKFGREHWEFKSPQEEAMFAFYRRKRQNAKSSKWEFAVKFDEIEWNTVCPVLGIELEWDNDSRNDNSPSFDRVNPDVGYVPGNVVIISWRANRIKNNGTIDEHERIASWMRKRLKKESETTESC